jgi:membrane protease subunit HflC
MIVLALLVMLVLLLGTVAYKVNYTDYVLIKTFGEVTAQYDGRQHDQAGLRFKWPWPVQKVVRYDARVFIFEDTQDELPTRDKQNILLTAYTAWRIADPKLFHTGAGTVEEGQRRLRDLVLSAKKYVIGVHNMADLVNTDPEAMRIPQIEQEILAKVQQQAMDDYGIEVVSVGLKSLGLPEQVSTAVITAMQEERRRDVARYQSAGEAQAQAIEARARTASSQIIEFANRRASDIRTEGDRQAARYYTEFARNEQFSMFLRSLESLRKELASKSVIVLDASQHPAIGFFRNGPSLEPFQRPPAPVGQADKPTPAAPAAPTAAAQK